MGLEKVVLLNPFRSDQRKTFPIELESGQALLEYVRDDGQQIITILNGEVIPPESRSLVIPKEGDQIIVAPELGGGGGGGKAALRILAMIALVVATVLVGIEVSFLFGPLMGSIAAGATMIAGSALINWAFTPSFHQSLDSQNYSWSGPQLTARQGIPIQKGYGKFRSGGNVISSYVYTIGDKQYLNVLICYGFGPALSIESILINDNPLANFKGIRVEKRLGSNTQIPVSFFKDTINEYSQSTRLKTGDSAFVIQGHRTDTEAIEVEFYYPKGLWAGPNNDGSFDNWTVYGRVEYKVHGASDSTYVNALTPRVTTDIGTTPYWLAIAQTQINSQPIIIVYATSNTAGAHYEGEIYDATDTVAVYDDEGTLIGNETRHHVATWTKNPANTSTGATPMGSTPQTVTNWSQRSFYTVGNNQIAKRHVVRIDHLTAGQYDIRVTKLGSSQNPGEAYVTPSKEDDKRRGEEMWVVSVREIIYDDFAYPNMVLLGIRALATDQLSGGGLNVTAEVDYGNSNPAVAVQEMMTNTLYGGRIPSALIDATAFDAWQDYCDEMVDDGLGGSIKRAVLNGVFDTSISLWEAALKVAAMSYAVILRTGLHYTVVLDKATSRTQLFTVGNIKKDTFKESWLPLADRANSIDIAFNDAADNYERGIPVTVQDEVALAAGASIRKAPTIDGFGITNQGQAWHLANAKLLANKYLLRTIEFQAPVEAIAAQYGDVIGVQHDLPQWGSGGRIVAVAGSVITLDRAVTMEAGHYYQLTVMHLSPQTLETKNVTTAVGTSSSIIMDQAFTTAPEPGANYAFGEVTQTCKDFRIVGLKRSSELEWTIQGIEYNPSLYADLDPVLPPAPEGAEALIQVKDLDVHEAYFPSQSQPMLAVSWTPGKYTMGADVYLSEVTGVPLTPIFSQAEDGTSTIAVSTEVSFCLTYMRGSVESNASKIVSGSTGAFGHPQAFTVRDRGTQDAAVTGVNFYFNYAFGVGPFTKINASPLAVGSAVVYKGAATSTDLPDQALTVAPEKLLQTVDRQHGCLIPVKSASTYTVRVVGYDLRGMRAPYDSAPTAEIETYGDGSLPTNVMSFRATSWSTPNASWAWDAVDDPDLDHYEMRYQYVFDGASWIRGTVVDAAIASSATTKSTTNGAGTYMIKAVNTDGRESAVEAKYVVGRTDTRSGTDPNPDPVPRGGTCFSGETLVETKAGYARIEDIKVSDLIRTGAGTIREVDAIHVHEFDGVVADMGCGKVTLEHEILYAGGWCPASECFASRCHFTGKMYNLTVKTEEPLENRFAPDTERSYVLENGVIAHNMKNVIP